MKRVSLVVPTVRILHSWKSYVRNFRKYGHDCNDINLIVVDDYGSYVKENIKLIKSLDVPFEFWTIKMQKRFFKDYFGVRWQKYWNMIPHHTDACRSFGYLIAALNDADVIITFDDDNWAINSKNAYYFDYLSSHSIIGESVTCTEVSSDKGWFNTCALLKTNPPKYLYPRGYPYSKRDESYAYSICEGRIAMNVGLWTGNPDVDSITILNEGSLNGLPKTRTIGLKSHERVMLAKGTFAPINTANTAYSTELLPCMYDTYQGAKVGEFKLDRYGDIWCNFFIKKIVDSVEDKITVGIPLVEHRREPRDTMIDFKKEIWGMIVSQRLFEVVESMGMSSKNYFDGYSELIRYLSIKIDDFSPNNTIKKYFQKLLKNMSKWLEIIDKLEIGGK